MKNHHHHIMFLSPFVDDLLMMLKAHMLMIVKYMLNNVELALSRS
jgi:hypothetical protein